MSTYAEGQHVTLQSAADLSAKQYYAVKPDANGKAVLCGAADAAFLGILADGGRKPNASGFFDSVDVVLFNGTGTFKVKVGTAAVAKDALLTTDANGAAVTATTGQRAFGRACAAGNAGDVIEYYKLNQVA
jgi:hypothetical protein